MDRNKSCITARSEFIISEIFKNYLEKTNICSYKKLQL